jgi:hypothetical protein
LILLTCTLIIVDIYSIKNLPHFDEILCDVENFVLAHPPPREDVRLCSEAHIWFYNLGFNLLNTFLSGQENRWIHERVVALRKDLMEYIRFE